MKAVVGMGNPLKSDDNIGNIVVDRLRIEDMVKVIAETTPENILGKVSDCDDIIFVDAIDFKGNVGDVKLFSLEDVEDVFETTHTIPISMFRSYFPKAKILIIGIQPYVVDMGTSISLELKEKVPEIVEKIGDMVKRL